MSSSGYQVKIYYIENQVTKEIRKFTIEEDVASNFEYLGAKIRRVFPSLLRKDFEVYWKDTDGDYLTISSNDELICAWDSIFESNGCLKLFVKVKKDEQEQSNNDVEGKEHPGVVCDGCDSKIQGIRFKCTTCFDFDLCSGCESKNTHPANHELLVIKSPREFGGRPRHPRFGPRCHQRGPFSGSFGPWRGPGGPWRGPGMFCRRSPFGGFAYSCGPAQRKRCGEEEKRQEPDAKRSCSQNSADEKSIGEAVANLAGCFGLDPEVAKCYFFSFSDDLKEQCEERKQQNSEKSADEKSSDQQEQQDFASNLASAFGLQEEFVRHFLTPFLSRENSAREESTQSKSAETKTSTNEADSTSSELETDVQQQTEEKADEQTVDFDVTDEDQKQEPEKVEISDEVEVDEESKQTSTETSSQTSKPKEENTEFKHELENMVKHFSEQFGIPNETQQNIQGGLETLLQGMFKFQQPSQSSTSNNEDDEEPRKPDEFVFVDKTNQEPQLTEEERYQKNLNEALDKMFAMGFDNDGGWLSQLLTSKDLSIDRVLEALNPSC